MHTIRHFTTRATGIFGGQMPPKISPLPPKIGYFRRQRAYFRRRLATKKTAENKLFSAAGSLAAENN
jgi:hypothetical protein